MIDGEADRPPTIQRNGSTLIVVTSTDRRGAQIEAVDLARYLRASDLDVRVVALASGDGSLDGVASLGRKRLSVATLRALRSEGSRASIVIAYGSTTLPACALAFIASRTRFVYRSIGDPSAWLRGSLHRVRTRLMFQRAAHVVALWSGAQDSLRHLHALDEDRLSVIPNARDAALFRPPTATERASARAQWGIVDQRPIVVMLGSLSPEKRPGRAIDTMAEIPGAHLLIAGDGGERRRVQAQASAAPAGNVKVIGAVSDPASVLHAADVLLLTSRTEGMPGVIIEAGLCGVPTVSPPVGAVSDLIEHGVSGWITPSDWPADLATGIRMVLGTHREMGEAARSRMLEQFTWESVAPQWSTLIDRLTTR